MKDKRASYTKKIITLLSGNMNEWVSALRVQNVAGMCHTSRISELKARGWDIENKTQWRDGARHSWYRLVKDA